MQMKNGGKSHWSLFLIILAGIVLGGFVGEYLGGLPYMDWLRFGQDFGFDHPLSLDLGIIRLQLSLIIRFNLSGILGMILAIIIYRKL